MAGATLLTAEAGDLPASLCPSSGLTGHIFYESSRVKWIQSCSGLPISDHDCLGYLSHADSWRL